MFWVATFQQYICQSNVQLFDCLIFLLLEPIDFFSVAPLHVGGLKTVLKLGEDFGWTFLAWLVIPCEELLDFKAFRA